MTDSNFIEVIDRNRDNYVTYLNRNLITKILVSKSKLYMYIYTSEKEPITIEPQSEEECDNLLQQLTGIYKAPTKSAKFIA
jgi:hypothetical protein